MSQTIRFALLVQRLTEARPRLQEALGPNWPHFEWQVAALLQALAAAEPADWRALLDDLLDLGDAFPAAREILAYVRRRSGLTGDTPPAQRLRGPFTPALPEGQPPADTALSDTQFRQGVMAVLPAWEQPRPVVNSGFASLEDPARPFSPETPLRPDTQCYFWLDVDLPHPESIEETPTPLPAEKLPDLPLLQVIVRPLPGELRLLGPDQGELQLLPDGRALVTRPAAMPEGVTNGERRLYFLLETPANPDTYRLRCDIYYRQVPVQSRLVSARITPDPILQPGSLRSILTYQLADNLRGEHLQGIGEHRLSLALHQDTPGTHTLNVLGRDGDTLFSNELRLPEGQMSEQLRRARAVLRRVAWGDERPWNVNKPQPYRYDGEITIDQLANDLFGMAIWGYRFFADLRGQLGGDRQGIIALQRALQAPGLVHFASHLSTTLLLPLAMVYDYPLDSNLRPSELSLCPDFEQELRAGRSLTDCACLQGACAYRQELNVVCPGGFWGYRHALGVPVATAAAPEVATAIRYDDAPEMIVSVATNLKLWEGHEKRLKKRWTGGWHYASTRDKMLALFRGQDPHLVYFYCHGGWTRDAPYLMVGPPKDRKFTADNLLSYEVFWDRRPLVLINGCHTTSLKPEGILNLVQGFVETANAAGVIGTDITIFEPLASAFAEAFVAFFAEGMPVGEAVRQARLSLLGQRNPLGLVYVPFALASLRLEAANPEAAIKQP